MIVWIALAFVVGFCAGGTYALWKAKRMRMRWAQAAAMRARTIRTTADEAEGDGDVIGPCGPICQECLNEGYPVWLCGWLA